MVKSKGDFDHMQFTHDMLTLGPDFHYKRQFTELQPFPFGY